MKKSILIIAALACFSQIFAGTTGWQSGEYEVDQLTIENLSGAGDACTGTFKPSLAPSWNQYFYIDLTTNLGKQLFANLMMAKATGKKVAIYISGLATGENRPKITGVSVH